MKQAHNSEAMQQKEKGMNVAKEVEYLQGCQCILVAVVPQVGDLHVHVEHIPREKPQRDLALAPGMCVVVVEGEEVK